MQQLPFARVELRFAFLFGRRSGGGGQLARRIARIGVRAGKIEPQQGVGIRLAGDDLLEAGRCLWKIAGVKLGQRAAAVPCQIIRLIFDRLVVVGDCFVVVASVTEEIAARVVAKWR